MGITDRLLGVSDRLWLRFKGLDHDIRLADDLENELGASDRRAMDDVLGVVEETFDDTGYSPGIYEVERMDADEQASGRYNGQEDARPQIEVDPETEPFPAIWAHEVGHHVADELDLTASGDTLLRSTFDELFAYMTAYTVMEETGWRQIYTGTPLRRGHSEEWQRLRDCFDEAKRAREEDLLTDCVTALDDGDWGAFDDASQELAATEPGVEPCQDELSLDGYTPSMATAHFFEEPERLKYTCAVLGDARQRAEHRKDSEAAELVYEAYLEQDDLLQERLASRVEEQLVDDPFGRHTVEQRRRHDDVTETVRNVEQSLLEDMYEDVLEAEIADSVAMLEEAVAAADTSKDVAAVRDELGNERYGYDAVEAEEYRDSFDLPHTIGNRLAKQCYRRGDDPLDIVASPEEYEALCDDALAYTIEQGLAGAPEAAYDLSGLLDE